MDGLPDALVVANGDWRNRRNYWWGGGGENCLVFFSQFLKAVDCDEEKSTKIQPDEDIGTSLTYKVVHQQQAFAIKQTKVNQSISMLVNKYRMGGREGRCLQLKETWKTLSEMTTRMPFQTQKREWVVIWSFNEGRMARSYWWTHLQSRSEHTPVKVKKVVLRSYWWTLTFKGQSIHQWKARKLYWIPVPLMTRVG